MKIDEMGCGGAGTMGFQLPLGFKERKKKLDRVMDENADIKPGHMLVFMRSIDENTAKLVCEKLDQDQIAEVADLVRETVVRMVVRQRMNEVVRKKGGKYVLYAPNRGKKKKAKAIRTFDSKLAAKKAELSQFPPSSPEKAEKTRKQIEKLTKDPKKRSEAERKERSKKRKNESAEPSIEMMEVAILAHIVKGELRKRLLGEGLFQQDVAGSGWDEYISKLSDSVTSRDKNFQRYTKAIDKASRQTMYSAVTALSKALVGVAIVKNQGEQQHDDGRSYVTLSLQTEDGNIEPVYVYVERGRPQVELSDQAKAAMTRLDGDTAKRIKGEFADLGELVKDSSEVISGAISRRDQYLQRLETRVDRMLSNSSPLELAMIKNLLVKKYRKMGQ